MFPPCFNEGVIKKLTPEYIRGEKKSHGSTLLAVKFTAALSCDNGHTRPRLQAFGGAARKWCTHRSNAGTRTNRTLSVRFFFDGVLRHSQFIAYNHTTFSPFCQILFVLFLPFLCGCQTVNIILFYVNPFCNYVNRFRNLC